MSRFWFVAGPCVAMLLAGVDIVSPEWPCGPEAATHTPAAEPGRDQDPPPSLHDTEVQGLPFCIARDRWSAGELGKTVLYRVLHEREGHRDAMKVGYFVYWSTERPWEDGVLSETFVRAFVTDALYSHFLFVFPGLQRAMYGAGDIEGVRVTYEWRASAWVAVTATADDGLHRDVQLDPRDFVDDRGRVIFKSDVWSHQLGARHAAQSVQQGATAHCFVGDALLPLSNAVAQAFRLGSQEDPLRARPAWKLDQD